MKCADRWTDPASGGSTPIGPYSCGRQRGHKGSHAHQGHGAIAAWDHQGNLLLSIQQSYELSSSRDLPMLDEDVELEGSSDA